MTAGVVAKETSKARPKTDKVVLKHADRVVYDQYRNPDTQVFIGNVEFFHNGLTLYCDSANYFQSTNSFDAFGNVKMVQGDTLSLTSDYLYYDGNTQIAEARRQVVLKHRATVLFTDSLNYDRVYNLGYFFEGGKLIDGGSTLTSDWGQYNTADRQALFNYHVRLVGEDMVLNTDTLYYDTELKTAHMRGPSNYASGDSRVYTEDGIYNTVTEYVTLLDRSVLTNKGSRMEGDSIIYDKEKGEAWAYRNITYNDRANKTILKGNFCYHNENTGFSLAYDSAVVCNYSEKDTLYLHADTFKIYTYNNKTDSAYRIVHGYYHARSFRADIQSVADSLSYNSQDALLILFGNPIVWSDERQILGERIYAFFNDSTIDSIRIVNQALLVEQVDTGRYNQVTGREMKFYFLNGELHENHVVGNVEVIYYAFDSDSILIGMNRTETSLLRMYMENRKTSKIWTSEATGTFYPIIFATADKAFLGNFAWFDYIRPKDKDDIFEWRAKASGTELRQTVRRTVPLQTLSKIAKKIE